ncbi:MAG TPA: hypothetical protein QGF66_04910 [SAR86 cluster bacterium]|jgi:hypothetical protein|nr:hypothetical protein [SAR86 cluster bacterium]
MTYLETENLVTIKEEISKFQSSYSDKNTKTHIVVQSIDGYQINQNEFDESTKELHSFIVNQTSVNSENQDISKNDLVYLITSTQLSLSGEQSLNIANINNLEEAQVQINLEVKCKENLLNLIKV